MHPEHVRRTFSSIHRTNEKKNGKMKRIGRILFIFKNERKWICITIDCCACVHGTDKIGRSLHIVAVSLSHCTFAQSSHNWSISIFFFGRARKSSLPLDFCVRNCIAWPKIWKKRKMKKDRRETNEKVWFPHHFLSCY